MPQKNSDELRNIGKELKQKHPEFKDFTDLEVGRIGIERGLWEEPQTAIDIPRVFQKAPREFVPPSLADKIAKEVDRIDLNISGFRAWYKTTGAEYRADYFVAMTNMLKQYAGVLDAQVFAQHAQANLARVHKDIQFNDQYQDAHQRGFLLKRIAEVQAAQAAADFTYQELEAGHEVTLSDLLLQRQRNQVDQAVAYKAWEKGVPVDVSVEEDKKLRMDAAQLKFLDEEAELQIKKRVRANNAHLLSLKELVVELIEAKTQIRKIEESFLPEREKRDHIESWQLMVRTLEREFAGRKDSR